VHLIFGVTVTIVLFFQLVGGWFLYYVLTGNKVYNELMVTKMIHKYSGNAIYLIAKINVLTGFFIAYWGYGGTMDILLYCIFIFTILWRVLFEVWYWNKGTIFMKLLCFTDGNKEEEIIDKDRSMSLT